MAQNQIARFPAFDKDNHILRKLSLPCTSGLGAGETDHRYPKEPANSQIGKLDYDSEKSVETAGHIFMQDYPPTMYREHSADLKDDSGEYDLASPAGHSSAGSWKESHDNGISGACSHHEHHNGGKAYENSTPSQPTLPDLKLSQSIRVFNPHSTSRPDSTVTEMYPSSPSNGHNTFIHEPSQLDSSTDDVTRRSHGLTYLSTFRSPYSVSSCSQVTGETEGMTSESASDEHMLSAQFPVNFPPLALAPLEISSSSINLSARLSRDSQATVVPQTLPFPGSL